MDYCYTGILLAIDAPTVLKLFSRSMGRSLQVQDDGGFLNSGVDREVAEQEFLDQLFYFRGTSCRGALSFQDLVSGLDGVMFNDLMENIEWFFNLHHDKNKDGYYQGRSADIVRMVAAAHSTDMKSVMLTWARLADS
ncbi:hypothetical protein F5887DRAFT_1281384 [Amanita rubescens]|nr:hypothetical protein F5887DRAFT_1281384 [Amanita rubescens]